MSAVADVPAHRQPPGVSLLRLDGTLRAAVPVADHPLAERALLAECRDLPRGAWSPAGTARGRRPLGAFLMRGVLLKEVTMGGRTSAQLVAPDDLFDAWGAGATTLPCETTWSVLEPARIALVEERFLAAVARWPRLAGALLRRLHGQAADDGIRLACASLPRVEDRLVVLFCQLAERWGVVHADGVRVDLALTHDLLGRLTAAKRPTVSLALRSLAEGRILDRDAAGTWRLAHDAARTLSRPAAVPLAPAA